MCQFTKKLQYVAMFEKTHASKGYHPMHSVIFFFARLNFIQ